MRRLRSLMMMGGLLGFTATFLSCDFSTGGDGGFNTSRANLEVNFSGQYLGLLSGGKAVSITSGAPITSFTIQQTGNTIQIIDSNGQTYQGVLGAPGAVVNPDSSATLPVGAQLAVFQTSWQGTDGVAQKQVKFTGVIDVVTIDRVEGDSTDISIDEEFNQESSSERDSNFDNSSESDSSQEIEGPLIIEDGGGLTNIFDITSSSSSSSSSSSDSSGSNSSSTDQSISRTRSREITTTFELSENNTQLRLRGTWVEEGGFVAQVSAASPGNGFFIGRVIVDDGTDGGGGGGGTGGGGDGGGVGGGGGGGTGGGGTGGGGTNN
jgi:hypothetical protein